MTRVDGTLPAGHAGVTRPGDIARRGARGRRGVTLMEVLATLVLVGIVLPVAMRGVTLSMQAAASARHEAEATRLAEAKLNELLVQQDTALLSGNGDFGEDWPEYRWEVTSVAREYGLYEAQVTVSWTRRGEERSVVLTSLMYPQSLMTQ